MFFIILFTIILYSLNMTHIDNIDIFTIIFNSIIVLLICILCIRKIVLERKRKASEETTFLPITFHRSEAMTDVSSLIK